MINYAVQELISVIICTFGDIHKRYHVRKLNLTPFPPMPPLKMISTHFYLMKGDMFFEKNLLPYVLHDIIYRRPLHPFLILHNVYAVLCNI